MAGNSNTYILPHHQAEWDRLQKQHVAWQMNMGYLVHPNAQHLLKPGARVADIACGMASWLRDLSKEVPSSVTLDGYDMNPPEQLKAILPSNIQVHPANVKEPFPANLHGTYDIVNVRLLFGGLTTKDWKPVVHNISQLVKPGGILQWTEPAILDEVDTLKGRSESTTSGMTQLFQQWQQVAMRRGWLVKGEGLYALPAMMGNEGLRVEVDTMLSDRNPDSRSALTEVSSGALFYTLRQVVETEGNIGSLNLEKIDDLVEQARQDIKSGAYWSFKIHVNVGFKPQ